MCWDRGENIIISSLEHILRNTIEHYKLLAIFFTMTLESACIPIPSEIVMTYAGFLVAKGRTTLLAAGLVGSLANLLGSWLAYAIGRYKGRQFIEKYGHYVFLSKKHLKSADNWFAQKGETSVFFARMLPGLRTFVSLPAGVARMDFIRFSIYSFLGSLPWNFALVYAGQIFTNRWNELHNYLQKLDLVFLVIVCLGCFFLWLRKRAARK